MDNIAYQISQLLLTPVLISVYIAFVYSLFEVGRLLSLSWLRKKSPLSISSNEGYPIMRHFLSRSGRTFHEMEVFALRSLETVRIVTRITPMLGLIATLIPMGPALIALQENNAYEMSNHLSIAFTAVTISLAAASLTFWVASVKKRWFAEELVYIEKQLGEA